jgi:uncharacterized protein YbcV (DUF1398 family)
MKKNDNSLRCVGIKAVWYLKKEREALFHEIQWAQDAPPKYVCGTSDYELLQKANENIMNVNEKKGRVI